jgi:hypothetical protein
MDARPPVREGPPSARSTVERLLEGTVDRYGLVLALLLVTYVLASALPIRGWRTVLLTAVQGATAVIAIGASGASERGRRIAAGAAACAVGIAAIATIAGGRAGGLPALISAGLLIASLIMIIRRLFGHERVTSQTLLGAMCCYVLFGLMYTFVYAAIDRIGSAPVLTPGSARSFSDYLFFSFTTLTTTGYGNFVPATGLARALAMLEALTGQLYLVTVVARMVALWMPSRQRRPTEGGQ